MAKGRATANLAGLAALGALGYMLSRDKKGEGAPVETRALSSAAAPAASPAAAAVEAVSDYPDESLRGRMATRPEDMAAPVSVAATRAPAAREAGAGRGGQGGPTAAELAAYSAARAPRAPARVVGTGSGRGGQGGPTAAELAAYEASRASARAQPYNPPPMTPAMRQQAEAQALQRVTPEEYLIGGPGIKGVAALAKGLANRGTARAAESTAPYLKELPAPGRTALPAPTPRLGGPSATELREAARSARATGRQEEMLRENAARYGLDPSAPGYEAAMRALRENIGGGSFTVKKKGGAVKAKAAKAKKMASGGSTSSASKRGDGIASRGKTKCKMY